MACENVKIVILVGTLCTINIYVADAATYLENICFTPLMFA